MFSGLSTGGNHLSDTRPLFGPADVLTALRIPLAGLFPAVTDVFGRLAILATAGLSDFFDGIVARRIVKSRAGAVLDPVADKIFMLTSFVTVGVAGALAWWEVLLLLCRDIAAGFGFLYSIAIRHPTTVSARTGGKWVTVGQFLTLLAFVLSSPLTRPLAWITIVLAAYAIWDYWRVGMAVVDSKKLGAAGARDDVAEPTSGG